MKKKQSLRVSEIFYSIQGEGPTAGCPSVFLRLATCNLMCGGVGTEKDHKLHNGATWRCDTIEVWRHGKEFEVEELIEVPEIKALLGNHARLIITGGEPLLQQEQIISFTTLLDLVSDRGYEIPIEIESNATIVPNDELKQRVTQWNFSPKLSNSGMKREKRIVPVALQAIKKISFLHPTYFKFVVSREEDMQEIMDDWVVPGYVSRWNIVLMPAASNLEELSKNGKIVAEICKREGLRMSNRMQITIWNKLTGV